MRLNTKKMKSALESRDESAAVIYCRVSDPEQVTSGLGLEVQETLCNAYAEENGLIVIETFIEKGLSAADSTKRKEYQRMLKMCLAHPDISKILVLHDDRFSADIFTVYSDIYNLLNNGIMLVDINNPQDLTTARGRKMLNTGFIEAHYERERGSERTLATMLRARTNGRFTGFAPMGYMNAKDIYGYGSLVEDPAKGPIVRKAFEMAACGGYDLEEILTTVNTLGLRTRYNNKLIAKTLRDMLRKPVYKGYQYVEEVGRLVEGNWKPLLDVKMFDAAQNLVRKRSSRRRKRKDDDWHYPLRRFLRCSSCGKLTGSLEKDFYRYYHCQARKKCGQVYVAPSALHAYFAFFLGGLVPHTDRLELLESALLVLLDEKREDEKRQVTAINRGMATLMRRKAKVEQKLVYGDDVVEDACRTELTRIDGERQEMQDRLDELEKRRQALVKSHVVRQFLHQLPVIWLMASHTLKQDIQAVLFPEPDSLEYSNQEGFSIPDTNLFFDGQRTLSFPEVAPEYDAKEFGKILRRIL